MFQETKGGKGLAYIEDSIDTSIWRLGDYIEKHEGGLITAIRNDTGNTMDNRMTINRKQKCEEKQLYGRFKRRNLDLTKKENLTRETESLLIAAQNNAVGTTHIKARIDEPQQNSKCRRWQRWHKWMQQISAEGI